MVLFQHVPDEDNAAIVYTYTLEMLKDGAWTSVYNGHGLWYCVFSFTLFKVL
jgi:hypothetical protein